ncbi:hypothetical protein L573_1693 [Bordetella holmesii H620]|nr:hypothetical protein L573_1693 [Bordetella holmesii H620]
MWSSAQLAARCLASVSRSLSRAPARFLFRFLLSLSWRGRARMHAGQARQPSGQNEDDERAGKRIDIR